MSDIVDETLERWVPADYPGRYGGIGKDVKVLCDTITALRAEISALSAECATWKAHTTRLQLDLDEAQAAHQKCRAEKNQLVLKAYPAMDERDVLRAEVERLRAALRNAYEVYAGSDGFIPETCAEGYQQQIIRQMVDCISAALTQPAEENPDG